MPSREADQPRTFLIGFFTTFLAGFLAAMATTVGARAAVTSGLRGACGHVVRIQPKLARDETHWTATRWPCCKLTAQSTHLDDIELERAAAGEQESEEDGAMHHVGGSSELLGCQFNEGTFEDTTRNPLHSWTPNIRGPKGSYSLLPTHKAV